MAGGEGSAAKINITQRRALALELRKQGGSYRDIAETLRDQDGISDKYDSAQAHHDVMFELNRLKAQNKELAESVLTMEQERLLGLWQVCYEKAMKGDLYAVDRCLVISDKLIRLSGVEPPHKIAPTTPDGKQSYEGAPGALINFYIPDNGRDGLLGASTGPGDSDQDEDLGENGSSTTTEE